MPHLADGQLHVWPVALHADRTTDALSADERARCNDFVLARDRNGFARTRAALRDVLASYVGGSPHAIALTATGTGKPRLVDDAVRFNVSHAGELAVIVVAAARDVGVDVEALRVVPDALAIAARALGAAAHTALAALPEPARSRAFLERWTRREAHAKARGGGLAQIEDAALEADPRWITYALDVGAAYVATAVAAAPACRVVVFDRMAA